MTSTLIFLWLMLVLVVFVSASAWRGLRYARAPMHLRWDLYPVAHESGPRRAYGGSYLEEKDWWTKPHKKSLFGEAVFMAEEIFFLRGVWENNRRLWWGSLPFHWGLYFLVGTSLGVFGAMAGWRLPLDLGLLQIGGVVGGSLLLVGSAILVFLRSSDPRLKGYTVPVDYINLMFLAIFGALCVGVALHGAGMRGVVNTLVAVFKGGDVRVEWLLAVQMAVGGLFLMYLPFTRMVHFFAKYFTYHDVRWDDAPMEPGGPLAARLERALNYGVDWSADHVGRGRTWAEAATSASGDEKEGGA